ncbi:GNAT family N-acetyltransferase [Streptomyces sp. NPDC006012]|uniref:GNAT family N-acetyltransferase n=1 Tax=Streptomyces sp. NPDC006012 TaxID=3364739 RepID=UPI0036D10AC1
MQSCRGVAPSAAHHRVASFWVGRRIRLRAMEPDDWGTIKRFYEELDYERSMNMLKPPRSAEEFRALVTRPTGIEEDGGSFRLAIEALGTGEMVGTVTAHGTDSRAGRFGFGVALGAGHRRQGYATEAAVILLRFMFTERRCHRCEARIFAYNQASLALMRSLGFVEEGRLRDFAFIAGRYHDLLVMSMLEDEFAALHTRERNAERD